MGLILSKDRRDVDISVRRSNPPLANERTVDERRNFLRHFALPDNTTLQPVRRGLFQHFCIYCLHAILHLRFTNGLDFSVFSHDPAEGQVLPGALKYLFVIKGSMCTSLRIHHTHMAFNNNYPMYQSQDMNNIPSSRGKDMTHAYKQLFSLCEIRPNLHLEVLDTHKS